MAGVGVIVGGIVAVGGDITEAIILSNVVLAYFAAFFATGAGNALNDLVDAETDKVNHPERPIPSGKLTPGQVKRVVWVGYLATLFLAGFVNILVFLIAVLNISLMIGYETSLKKKGFIGNLSISYLTGSVFIFGGAATLSTDLSLMEMVTSEEFKVTLILALLAFLVSVGREIIKDVQDMEGDKDRFTLPMKIGKRYACYLAGAMILTAIGLSWLPYYPLDILGKYYIGTVLIADALFLNTVILAFTDPAKAQKLAKLAMFIALIAFLIGGLTV